MKFKIVFIRILAQTQYQQQQSPESRLRSSASITSTSGYRQSISDSLHAQEGCFTPDYTVYCIENTSYMKVTRSMYMSAIRTTLIERQRKPNHSENPTDEEGIQFKPKFKQKSGPKPSSNHSIINKSSPTQSSTNPKSLAETPSDIPPPKYEDSIANNTNSDKTDKTLNINNSIDDKTTSNSNLSSNSVESIDSTGNTKSNLNDENSHLI